MSEMLITAKPDQRLWFLSNEPGPHEFHIVDVLAWVIKPFGPPTPITPFGRFADDVHYVVSSETGWISPRGGEIFRSSGDVAKYLKALNAV